MDNMKITQSPAALLSKMQGTQGLRGLLGMGGLFGSENADFFTMMMQQIAAMTSPDAALFGEQASTDDAQLDGQKKAQDTDPWMQLLAGMMAADGMNEQMIIQMLMQQPTEQTEQLIQTISGASEDPVRAMFSAMDTQQQNNARAQESEQLVEVLQVPKAAEEHAEQKQSDGLFWSGRFQSAVTQAQKMMRDEGGRVDEGKIDVEALQGEVGAGRYVSAEMNANRELPLPEAKDVADQVRAGITKNLSTERGKDEFVVKLKPEGLGEVVVRLTQTAGKMTLSIVTSSEQTARLLNSELTGLRESLKPWNADVREVISEQQQQHAENSYEQAQYGQQSSFADQRHNHGAHAQEEFSDVLFGEEEPQQPESISAGVYI